MRLLAFGLTGLFAMTPMVWADEPPDAHKVLAESTPEPALLASTADGPQMTLGRVVALFSPHYDLTQYPMLADPKAREFMEVGTYRHLYWMLTGGDRTPELKSQPLSMPRDGVHHVWSGQEASEKGFRERFGTLKVKGLAFPESVIVFFRGTPANVDGVRNWDIDDPNKLRADMDVETVFARIRWIVELDNGSYLEESTLWGYEPEKKEFTLYSMRMSTINDGLTMLMRLHSSKDPAEW